MPFRKKAKGLKVRGKHDDVKSVKSLSAQSNEAGVVMEEASSHNSGSRRIGPVKRSATDSKRSSTQRNLNAAADSASAQPSGYGSSPLASRDSVGSPSRRSTTRQTTRKAELATDLPGRKSAGALPPGGKVRQERPLSKATRSSKVDDSQQATLTPARARATRTSQPVAKTRGTIRPRSAEEVEARSGAAGSSRSKPEDAQTKAREIPSPEGPALVAKRSPKPTSVPGAAEQNVSATATASSAPPTNRSGRRGPAKRSLDAPKVGEQAGPVAQQQKRATRATGQPKPHCPPARGAGRTRAESGSEKGANTKEKLAKGKVTKGATPQAKTSAARRAAKQKQVGKKRRGEPLDTEEASSDATDSSYVVPRGLLQPYRRKDRFFDDYVKPWQEEEYFWSDSESEDISNASISSIIPPPGLLQPYRKKRRLIGTSSEDSLSESDADYEEEEDLSARCHRIFGMDMLPNSTTTKAEAISMLVSFVSSRRLPWGALAELVTLVNKLFAPAKNVLPDSKALADILSHMP